MTSMKAGEAIYKTRDEMANDSLKFCRSLYVRLYFYGSHISFHIIYSSK